MRTTKFILKNALFINLLSIFVIGSSLLIALKMRVDAFPEVAFDLVIISTVYPGASPKEVEVYVTDPLEEELGTVQGIDEMNSISSEGFSLITIQLDIDRSKSAKAKTVNEIYRAIDRVQDLPTDLPDRPKVREVESGNTPVIEVTLSGDVPYAQLHQYADQLKDRLESVNDVSKVEPKGYFEREFWVEIDPKKLEQYELSLQQVVGVMAARNINLPGGAIKRPNDELLLRTLGQLTTPKELEDMIVRVNDYGNAVRIGDLGRVIDTFEDPQQIYRTNGNNSINLMVVKAQGGDILDMVANIKEVNQDFLAAVQNPNLHISYINDYSVYVENRLGIVVGNGIVGIILVLLTLFIFVSPGMAIVTAIGIPAAGLITLMTLEFMGITINLLSMFGMVIVLGMLVDDAIVISENIWQHYEGGKPPWSATIDGLAEVVMPVAASVLTTIVAFFPMMLVPGIFGQFLFQLPLVVILALTASFFEAVFILPLHAYDILRLRDFWQKRRGKTLSTTKKEHFIFGPVLRGYGKVLGLMLRRRYLFMLAVLSFFGFTLWFAGSHMKFILFPSSGIETFFLQAKLPVGQSLEDTSEIFKGLEDVVKTLPANEMKDYVTNIGIQQNDANDPFTERGPHLGQIAIYLTPASSRVRSAQEILESLRPEVTRKAKELGITNFSFNMQRSGPPVGKPVAIKIKGDELAKLDLVATEVTTALNGIAGVNDIVKDFNRGKDEYAVYINEQAAAQALLDAQTIAMEIRAAFAGQIASFLRINEDRVALRIRLPLEARQSLTTLENLKITNRAGHLVALRDVVTFERQQGLTHIIRRDEKRAITITANIDETRTTSQIVNKAIAPIIKNLETQYSDVSLELSGEYEDTAEGLNSLKSAFTIAMALIFLILATQFKSLSQPIIIILAIPFGIIGVVWAFYLHAMPLSFLAMIGVVGLAGVVVNNSIVLVDFINNLRASGVSIFDACLQAGVRRLRAVFLTTMTTIFGILPLVYGIGGRDEFLRPAAMSLGYGLLFGTILVMFMTPATYMIYTDIGLAWQRLGQKLRKVANKNLESGH